MGNGNAFSWTNQTNSALKNNRIQLFQWIYSHRSPFTTHTLPIWKTSDTCFDAWIRCRDVGLQCIWMYEWWYIRMGIEQRATKTQKNTNEKNETWKASEWIRKANHEHRENKFHDIIFTSVCGTLWWCPFLCEQFLIWFQLNGNHLQCSRQKDEKYGNNHFLFPIFRTNALWDANHMDFVLFVKHATKQSEMSCLIAEDRRWSTVC